MFSWVGKIGEIYHVNNLRCKEFDSKLPVQWQAPSFKTQHEKLVEKMDAMAEERDVFINTHNPDASESNLLSKAKYKILISLQTHWKGLNVFMDHPEVPSNPAGSTAPLFHCCRQKNCCADRLWCSRMANCTKRSIYWMES